MFDAFMGQAPGFRVYVIGPIVGSSKNKTNIHVKTTHLGCSFWYFSLGCRLVWLNVWKMREANFYCSCFGEFKVQFNKA